MSDVKELKQCPFCGGQKLAYWQPCTDGGYGVACNDCHVTMDSRSTTVDQAAKEWNRRAALSGTREAVEPVAWAPDKLWLGCPDADGGQEFWFDHDEGGTLYVRADLRAAPPSDPVGQGVVTVAPLEWEERSGSLYADTAMGEVCIDEHYDGFSVIESGRLHEGFASQEAAQAFLQKNHDARVSDWLEPSTLSPAPEAGSDEVGGLRKRAKKSWNDLQLVWDGILGNRPRCRDCADEDGICPHSKLPCDPTEAAVAQALIWKNETTALRDQLGKMREACGKIAWIVAASPSSDDKTRLHKALDALDDARAIARDALRATLAETQEAGR